MTTRPRVLVLLALLALLAGAASGAPVPSSVQRAMLDSPPVVASATWVPAAIGSSAPTLFVLSERGTLYRSSDGGVTFDDQEGRIDPDGSTTLRFRSIVQRADEPHHLLFIGVTSGVHAATKDAGQSYTRLRLDDFDVRDVIDARFHPNRTDALLLQGAVVEGSELHIDLLVSLDFGASFHVLAHGVLSFEWARSISAASHAEMSVIVTRLINAQDQQLSCTWSPSRFGSLKCDPLTTADLFIISPVVKQETLLARFTYQFVSGPGLVFAHQLLPPPLSGYPTERAALISSVDGLSFANVTLPDGGVNQQHAEVVDHHDGAVMLHVRDMLSHGNLLISDSSKARFSVSLPQLLHAGDVSDLVKVEGLEGVYLANQLTPSAATVRTLITFDKGGSWQLIPSPMSACHISSQCSLQLFLRVGQAPPLVSSSAAPGLIVAAGHSGVMLNLEYADSARLVLSRDGGRSWQEVQGVPSHADAANFGSVLGAVAQTPAQMFLNLSLDQGSTWSAASLALEKNEQVSVHAVLAEPANLAAHSTTARLLLLGTNQDGYGLAFLASVAGVRACTGADAPDEEASDFETWSPTDDALPDDRCLLGHRVRLTRREKDSQCIVTASLAERVEVSHCLCTEEDWECDFGFQRMASDPSSSYAAISPCVPQPGFNVSSLATPPADCPTGNFYSVSRGYRLIPGDTCFNGTDHSPDWRACPVVLPPNEHLALMVVLILLVTTIVCLVLVFIYQRERVVTCMRCCNREPSQDWQMLSMQDHDESLGARTSATAAADSSADGHRARFDHDFDSFDRDANMTFAERSATASDSAVAFAELQASTRSGERAPTRFFGMHDGDTGDDGGDGPVGFDVRERHTPTAREAERDDDSSGSALRRMAFGSDYAAAPAPGSSSVSVAPASPPAASKPEPAAVAVSDSTWSAPPAFSRASDTLIDLSDDDAADDFDPRRRP